jgi:hypothetical protein
LGTASAYWQDIYLPLIVKPIEELVSKANSLGTQVRPGTLNQLTSATERSSVVIVIAHWRDSQVDFDDLTVGLPRDAWRDRSLKYGSPLAGWLASRLEIKPSPLLTGWFSPFLSKKQPDSVDKVLREALQVELPEEDQGSHLTRVRESSVTRAARRRTELDLIFDGMIRPGNRLELLDGLHAKEDVEEAVASDFVGVLDFASCSSTILADYLGRKRKNKIRLVQAQNPIEFVGTAPILASTLELLSGGLFSYQEARLYATALWEGGVCAN